GLVAVSAEKNRTELARQGEARQRARAEAGEKEARTKEEETRAVLGFVQDKILAAARPEGEEGGLGREVTLRKALEAALPEIESSFRGPSLVEASIRMTLGDSLAYLGEAKAAERQLQIARKLYTDQLGPELPDTLQSMNKLANSYLDL